MNVDKKEIGSIEFYTRNELRCLFNLYELIDLYRDFVDSDKGVKFSNALVLSNLLHMRVPKMLTKPLFINGDLARTLGGEVLRVLNSSYKDGRIAKDSLLVLSLKTGTTFIYIEHLLKIDEAYYSENVCTYRKEMLSKLLRRNNFIVLPDFTTLMVGSIYVLDNAMADMLIKANMYFTKQKEKNS